MDIGWFVCGFTAGLLALLLVAVAGVMVDEWKAAKKAKAEQLERNLLQLNGRLDRAEGNIRNLDANDTTLQGAARKYAVSYTDASLRVHETEFHAPKKGGKK